MSKQHISKAIQLLLLLVVGFTMSPSANAQAPAPMIKGVQARVEGNDVVIWNSNKGFSAGVSYTVTYIDKTQNNKTVTDTGATEIDSLKTERLRGGAVYKYLSVRITDVSLNGN